MLSFALYIYTLSPSVYGGDSGDLTSSVFSLGVAHPSGYPLYIILGRLVTELIPDTFSFSWQLGALSATLASFSLVFFNKAVYIFCKNKLATLISTSALAVSYPFWLFAITQEVFALHVLLLSLIFFIVSKIYESKKTLYLNYLAFLVGLSLTNNQSIILFFPPVFLFLTLTFCRDLFKLKTIFTMIIFFMLGLVPYIYIPFAAAQFPQVNWGFAVNWENFTHLITREEYGWNPLSGGVDRVSITSSLWAFVDYWKYYIGWLFILTCSLGFSYLIKRKLYRLLILISLSFFLSGPFYVAYANTPLKNFLTIAILEKFFLANFFSAMYLFPFGIIFLHESLRTHLQKILVLPPSKFVYFIYLIGVFGILITNFPKLNLRNIYLGENFAKDILSPLPKDSVVLLMSDTMAFNSIHVQITQGFRNDIKIPGLYNGFDNMLKISGLSEEHILDYKIKNRGSVKNEVMGEAISDIAAAGNIFSDQEFEALDSKYGKIVSVPWGLLYKLELEENSHPKKEDYLALMDNIFISYHLEEVKSGNQAIENSLTFADIKKLYSISFERVAQFVHEEYNDDKKAAQYLKETLLLDPLK